MADQTPAETGALKALPPPRRAAEYTLGYKLAWRLRLARAWARFLLTGPNHDVPQLANFISENRYFRAIQVPSELAALGGILARLRPERALEIGTAHGGTLLFLTRLASPKATIVSVDLPGGEFGGGYSARRKWFYKRFARRGQRLHLLQGDSHSPEMAERVKGVFSGRPLDYLFIDGDHTYQGVKKDFEAYSLLVRSGGVVAFHDIAEHPPAIGCGVSRFWNLIKSGYRHEEIVEDRGQGWAGIGVLHLD